MKQLRMGLLRLVHSAVVPKGGAAEVEAVESGAPEVSSLGWSTKGWSS